MSLTSPVTDLRVSITRVTAAASHSSVSTPHLASEDPRPKFKVSLRIIRGLGLIAADQTGSSDPYCVISAAEGSRTLQTKIIQQCLDPV
jgi:Ca2+-dependent lipid-binding protein